MKKAAANADVVIVTMHAGAEGSGHTHVIRGTEMFLGENRGNSRAFTHAVVDAGADLVIGSGPHVLRGMEWYRGHLIAYSLGNFAGYKVFSLGGPLSISGILRVTLRGNGAFDSATLVPTRMVGGGMPALDPAESAHGIVRTLSREDFGSSRRQGLGERRADALDARCRGFGLRSTALVSDGVTSGRTPAFGNRREGPCASSTWW